MIAYDDLKTLKQLRWGLECRTNLQAWVIEALKPYNQVPVRHHLLLLQYLEKVAHGEIDRLMVLLPPGSAKSTYCSVLFPAWLFAQRPNLDVIGASHGSELAEDFSGRIQRIIRQHPILLGYGLASENVQQWRTTNGGTYRAAGVGGSITGRRSDIGIIDDPVKGALEAESSVTREGTWKWYQEEFYTRLKPGGAVIVIMCMTGDTPVRMADGTERRLDRIRTGDMVATYEEGRLATARVLGWKNQGEDSVYEIRMTSGRAVRANERHPFLVKRGGSTVWVRLRNLSPGDHIVALPVRNATSLQDARVSACATIQNGAGQVGFDLHPIMPPLAVQHECATATVSDLTNTMHFSRHKAACAASAEDRPRLRQTENIGQGGSQLTTITQRTRFADSSVTTATSWSGTREMTPNDCGPPSHISFKWDEIVEIVPSGRAEVYDVQIERTENFIANGLVSHNTRWNGDDLGGRLLAAQATGGDKWTVLKLPAVADAVDDPIGRPIGTALWPEWQNEEALARIRTNVGEHAWGALYQQDPKPRGASFFDLETLLVNGAPVALPLKCDTVFAVIDTAIKSGQEHNATAVAWYSYNALLKPQTTLILDYDIIQIEGAAQADWLASVHARGEELARQCGARVGYAGAMIEDKATGTVLIQQSQNQARKEGRQRSLARAIDMKLTAMGKEERAIAAAPYVIAGQVKLTDFAFNKVKVLKGQSANHLIKQITDFRLGSKQKDGLDLLDVFCYGVLITCGTNAGERRGI